MKHYQQNEQNSTTQQPKKHCQDSTNLDPLNIEPSKRATEQSKDAKIRVFYKVIMAVAIISMIFVGWFFMATEGEKSLIKETGLNNYSTDEHFVLFITHFNRSYPTEEHKSDKMLIFHRNHNELILRNMKNIEITDGVLFQFDDSTIRVLAQVDIKDDDQCLQSRFWGDTTYFCTTSSEWCTGDWSIDLLECCPCTCNPEKCTSSTTETDANAELTTEVIAQGTTWTQQKEAYDIGCEGRVFCFLLSVNANMDETTEEFFQPRRNPTIVYFEYYVSLTGNPPSSLDKWMQYMSDVRNQGATTTCYLQVQGTVVEMLMAKRLREVPQDKRPALIAEMKYQSEDPSKEISWPDHCVLDANMIAICDILHRQGQQQSAYESLKGLPHIPNARNFLKQHEDYQTCTTKEELESNELYLDITSENYQDDLDKFFSNDAALKNKYFVAVCGGDGKYHGQTNSESPLTFNQAGNSWVYVPGNNPIQLQLHLTYSPVTIVMYVCDPFDFKNFGIGVYRNSTECNETLITHTAVVVGYGETEKGEEYWELLNSYGSEWGTDGTIRLARNTAWDQYGGQNGILIKPAWQVPTVFIDENGDYHSRGQQNRWSYYYKDIGCKQQCAWWQSDVQTDTRWQEIDMKNWSCKDFSRGRIPTSCAQYF